MTKWQFCLFLIPAASFAQKNEADSIAHQLEQLSLADWLPFYFYPH